MSTAMPPPATPSASALHTFSEIAGALAILAYATGFLVVLNFLAMLGLEDSAADLFRLKYVHIGILCLVPIALAGSITIAITVLIVGRNAYAEVDPSSATKPKLGTPSGIVLVLILLIALYLLLMFTTSGFLRERHLLFAALFVTVMIGLLFANDVVPQLLLRLLTAGLRSFEKGNAAPSGASTAGPIPEHTRVRLLEVATEWLTRWAPPLIKWCLVVVAAVIATFCFVGGPLGALRTTSVGFYCVLLACLCYLLVRYIWLQERWGREHPRFKFVRIVLGALIALLYYALVVTFAYTIYPLIPASRGGMDLSHSMPVQLVSDASLAASLPTELLSESSAGRTLSAPLVLLDQDSESVVVVRLESYRTWLRQRGHWPTRVEVPRSYRIKFGRNQSWTVVHDASSVVEEFGADATTR